MSKRILIKSLLTAMFLFLTFVGYSSYSIWSYSNYNQLVKTDAAIVLGAAVWGDQPSPVLRERINHAIWLYQHGYVDKIIFTGGKANHDAYAESEVARAYAITNGVNVKDILIETKSKITEQNLEYAFEVAKENGLKTFTVVSDPLHMKRSIMLAEDKGMEVYSSPTPTSMYRTLKSKLPFFSREVFYFVGYNIVSPFR
jgi:uncharacterized SAM-binding protein YcdF (DUF218 family)